MGRNAFHSDTNQIAFEKEWVRGLARKLFKKGSEPDSPDALKFYGLVHDVAAILAVRGNAITAPSGERLRVLVTRIARDGYSYGEW